MQSLQPACAQINLSAPCVLQYDTIFKATPPADLVWFNTQFTCKEVSLFRCFFELLAPGF
jgi:hypothetical protein